MELEESTFLTSDYTTNYSHQYSMVLAQKNKNIEQWNKIESPEKTHAPMGTLFLTKEARIYNGAKIAS